MPEDASREPGNRVHAHRTSNSCKVNAAPETLLTPQWEAYHRLSAAGSAASLEKQAVCAKRLHCIQHRLEVSLMPDSHDSLESRGSLRAHHLI